MPNSATRIHLCGELRVAVAGADADPQPRGRQGRAVFAYLVLNRHRPVRRDELLEALATDGGAAPTADTIAPVLSRLRRALAPAEIEGRQTVTLRLPEPAWVDVEVIPDLLRRARALLAQDPPAALAAARQAAALAGPGLLPGLDAPWVAGAREAIADARVDALEVAAVAGTGVGGAALATAEADARAAVAAAPFRESARVALIEVLRARGNLAEALRAFEEVRLLLREELGAPPGPALLALHRQLLDATAAPSGPSRRASAGLVERDTEVAAIDRALDDLAAGRGGVLVFEGAAGIGKTRLLAELRSRAGVRVVEARAGVLEREYGFGVVRQLLAAAAAEPGVLDGPAAPARAVVAETAGAAEGSFATLDGLFQLTARLAPVVLCVDDLQWSDPASLRFVAYLARRVAGLPILVAATVRTGEPGSDEALLAEISGDPAATALRPAPLSEGATGTLVRARLGTGAEDAFVAACQDVTAGNPLLLGQLLTALDAERVIPDAAHAEEVLAVGPRAVSRTVLARLGRLRPDAVAVARAVAILGEDPDLRAVAALAGTDEGAAAAAVEALARAEILRPEAPLGFVHPLVRDAVYADLPAATRGREHARAARVLAELDASPESVAAQLLLAPPQGDAWAVGRLREAAAVARRRGAPDAAMTLLERAQAEPPPPGAQAAVALELGESAAYVRGPAGVAPLRRAYAELTDPADRGRAAIRLSQLLMFVSSPQEGVELARRAAAELPPDAEDARQGLRANRLVGVGFGAADDDHAAEIEAVRRGPRGRGPGARSLTAMVAFAVALLCGPVAEVLLLAREALETDGLAGFDVTAPVALASAALTLCDPGEGLRAVSRYTEHASREGEILGSIGADLWGGFARIHAGDLHAATASLQRAHEGERLWGTKLDAVMGYSSAFAALTWHERGNRERAWAALRRVDAGDGSSDGARFWLASRAELLLADGDAGAALAITRRLEGMRPPDTHPIWAPWRRLRAQALAQLGHRDQAVALATAELELARRTGAPWLIGRGLRVLAEIEGPGAGDDHAREAVALLTESSARLELAKALAAAGYPDRAHDIADQLGAVL